MAATPPRTSGGTPYDGPRYPGSIVVHHLKANATEVVDRYRRHRKRRTELPRAVSLLLAWEGALVAGVCLAALGHVALTAYAMERHDERVRRAALVRYYTQRLALADEAIGDLAESFLFYSRQAAQAQRSQDAAAAALATCQVRLTAGAAAAAAELAPLQQRTDANGGGGSALAGRLWRALVAAPVDLAVGPWREMYVRWRLGRWRQQLEMLQSEAAQAHEALQHHSTLAGMAAAKAAQLRVQLEAEAAGRGALAARLSAWRAQHCRREALAASGGLWWPARPGASWHWAITVFTPTWADEEEEEQQLRQLAEQLGLPAGVL